MDNFHLLRVLCILIASKYRGERRRKRPGPYWSVHLVPLPPQGLDTIQRQHDLEYQISSQRELSETQISLDVILFLESTVHFDSYTVHITHGDALSKRIGA